MFKLNIDKMKEIKINKLKQAYNTIKQTNIAYMSTTFQADIESQNFIVSVLSAGSVPDGFYWLDIANNQVAMEYSELQGLSKVILIRGQINFAKLQDFKANVGSSTTVEELDLIVW